MPTAEAAGIGCDGSFYLDGFVAPFHQCVDLFLPCISNDYMACEVVT